MNLPFAQNNYSSPTQLSGIVKYHYERLSGVEEVLDTQAIDFEKQHYPDRIPNDDIQRLHWIQGIGKMNAFTILLETNEINRFEAVNNFFSYCRLVPSTRNTGSKTKQRSSKDGNK